MGIFDRFKNKQEQLEEVQKSAPAASGTAKTTKTEKKSPKPTTKQAAPVAPKKVNGKSVGKRVLVRPVVSEKSTHAVAQGKYTFVVTTDSTKVDIKQAVRALYGVEPTHVRVMNFEGKRVRFGRRLGRRSDWKKAVVTLPKGKTISVHEGV